MSASPTGVNPKTGAHNDPYRSRNNAEEEGLIGGKRKSQHAPSSQSNTADNDADGNALLFYFVIMLFCAMGNKVFGRLEVYPMHNYPLFLNLILTFIYIPVCWVYIIPVMLCTKDVITKEQRAIPKYKFAIMGAYDSVSSLLSTLAINYIKNSTLMVLVSQAAIPISMIISKIALDSKYTRAQYLGASVVMLGIISVLVPSFFVSNTPGTPVSKTSADNDVEVVATVADNWQQLCWLGVLVISTIPSVLSSVYKEKALGEIDVDVNYLNGWVAIFQSIIAIPLCLPTAQIQNIPLEAIPDNLYGGLKCWMGLNTVSNDFNPYNAPLDNCTNGPIYVTGFIIFNIAFNFMTVLILKYGSANILFLASTILVPVSNAVFSMKIFPGSKPMTIFDGIGLAVIMSGLVIYRFSNVVISVWHSIIGADIDLEELRKEKIARKISRIQERRQVMYMGLNQVENLQSLLDTRVYAAQLMHLVRDPKVIREKYLLSIGVPPSPALSVRSINSSSIPNSPAVTPGQGHPQYRQYQHQQQRRHEFELLSKRSNSIEQNTHSYLNNNNTIQGNSKTSNHQHHQEYQQHDHHQQHHHHQQQHGIESLEKTESYGSMDSSGGLMTIPERRILPSGSRSRSGSQNQAATVAAGSPTINSGGIAMCSSTAAVTGGFVNIEEGTR